jgi:hypothetical protein
MKSEQIKYLSIRDLPRDSARAITNHPKKRSYIIKMPLTRDPRTGDYKSPFIFYNHPMIYPNNTPHELLTFLQAHPAKKLLLT